MVVEGPGRPLMVDWTPEQPVDLEVAMGQGIAVVHYTGAELGLLGDCTMEGKYGFVGVTQKSDVVRLESSAEIQANLPLAGAGLLSQTSSELGRGSTLDVAITWSRGSP